MILTFFFSLLPVAAQAATLKQGNNSRAVEALQQALKSKGYFSASSTGYYGKTTTASVKKYQKAVKLSADGIAGQKTLTSLGLVSTAKTIKSGTVKISGTLNLRYGPSTSVTVLCELNNGEKVSILSESGGWYKIRTSFEIEGYVYKSYVAISSSSSSSSDSSSSSSGSSSGSSSVKQGKVKVSTKLTVRSGPGKNYSAKGYLRNNTAVTISDTQNGWYKITTASGISGYCSSAYITVTGSASGSSSSSSSTVTKPTSTLKYRMSGNDVVKLQQRLKELGYFSGNCTGYFGSVTLAAVKKFQKANSLTADGIAGPLTLNALFDTSAEAKPEVPAPSTPSDKAEQTIQELIAYAKTFLGVPYVYGANGPKSFDCTGYTCYIFKHFGYSLPRTAYNQGYSNYAPKIEKVSDLKPGDLVFFNTVNDNDRSDHAGIYLGNNQFIHCNSGSSMKVVIQDITNSYYKPRFSWGRRVIS